MKRSDRKDPSGEVVLSRLGSRMDWIPHDLANSESMKLVLAPCIKHYSMRWEVERNSQRRRWKNSMANHTPGEPWISTRQVIKMCPGWPQYKYLRHHSLSSAENQVFLSCIGSARLLLVLLKTNTGGQLNCSNDLGEWAWVRGLLCHSRL